VSFCDGHVESPALKFLFANTSDAALAHWKSFRSDTMRTATNHLPHRGKSLPNGCQYFSNHDVLGGNESTEGTFPDFALH